MEINSLVIQVKSDGITKATQDLNDLSKAAEKAEASTSKLGDKAQESGKKQEAASQALWDSLVAKADKYYSKQYDSLLKQNDRLYAAIQAEANRMNAVFDARVAAERSQTEALDMIRYKARSKEAADLQRQNETLDLLRYKESQKAVAQLKAQLEEEDMLRYKARMKQEAEDAAFAERQLVMNASFAAKSAAAQARLVNEAMLYGQGGGDITSRYGSGVAAMATAEGYAKLKAEAEAAAHATHEFSLANAASTRELMVLGHELSQGNFKRFGGSLMVLSNQSGLFVKAVAAIGIEGIAAFAALAVAVGAATYEIIKGAVEVNTFEKSLELTGNMAGLTRDSLNAMADSLANGVTGGTYKAKGVLEELAATGKFTNETMQVVGQSVLEFMHLSGESSETAIKLFEGMADGVAKWAAKANESYHFLTYEQYAHIELLEKQNQKTEAIIETSKAFNTALDDHERKVGVVVKWYRGWVFLLDKLKEGLSNFGAGDTDGDKLIKQSEKVNELFTGMMSAKKAYEALPNPLSKIDYDRAKEELSKALKEQAAMASAFRDKEIAAGRKSADDEIQAQAIAADREAKLMDKRMRTKEEKRLDTMAENESTRVAVNAGVLSTELAKRGVQYSEIAKQAKEADAAEVAQIKLSGKERVSARDNEFQLQLKLAEQYGIKLVTDAKRLEEQKAAIEQEFKDPKGPADDPRSKALTGALAIVDREVQATKKAEQEKLEQVKLGAKAKEYTEDEASEKAKQAVRDAEAAEVASLSKRFDAIKVFHAKTKVEQQAAENYTKETQDRIEQVHKDAAAKIEQIDSAEKARKQKEEDDYLKAIFTKGEQEIHTLETSLVAQQKYAREVGKTREQVEAIRAAEAAKAAQQDIDQKAAIEDLLKRGQLQDFARKALEAELVILERKVELNKEIAETNLEGSMNAALSNLDKLSEEVYHKEKIASGESLKDIIGTETAKTVFIAEERRKRLAQDVEDAQNAYNREKNRGIVDPEKLKDAGEKLEDVKKKAEKVGKEISDALKLDLKVTSLKDIASQFDVMAKSAATFGDGLKNVSVGLEGFSTAFKNLAKAQEEENTGSKEAFANKIGAYGDMAAAASNFFDKQSAGYAGLQKIAQAFHAAQMAMQLVEMAQSAVAAVLKAGAQMGIPGAIAMSAIVAGLGFSVMGHGNGGMSSADRQSIQGTGSILGSPTVVNGNKVELVGAKSESITKSLSILEKNSGLGLVDSDSMLTALNKLNDSIAGFAKMIVQTTGINGNLAGTDHGGAYNFASSTAGTLLLGGPITTILNKLTGGFVGKVFGTIANAIFGGNTTTLDTGFMANKASLGQVLGNGISASQYTNTKTDGGWFHSDKYNTSINSLGADTNDQFTKVILNMADTLHAAAKQLGMDGNAFTDKLNSFVVDIGTVSLKGMTGDQIQQTIQSIFSKLGDDMANYAFSDFKQFQKIGEGMLETVSRVANDLQQVNDVFTVLGKNLPTTLAGISNAENLIASFGTVDKLTKGIKSYMDAIYSDQDKLALVTKSVKDSLASLGLSGITTNAQLKKVVDGLDLTKQADVDLLHSLINLAPAFAQVTEAANKAAEDLMNGQLADVDNAFNALTKIVDRQKKSIQEQADAAKAAAQKQLDAAKTQVTAIQTVFDSLTNALKSTTTSSVQFTKAQREEAQAYISMASSLVKAGADPSKLGGLTNALDTLQQSSVDMFSNYQDYAYDQAKTANSLGGLQSATKQQLDYQQAIVDKLDATIKAIDDQTTSELNKLDKTVQDAQDQVDVLKGQSNTLLSIDQGIQALQTAILAAMGNSTIAGNSAINTAYQQYLGRGPDTAGLKYWKDQLANGTPIDSIVGAIKNSPEATIQGIYKSVLGRTADAAGLNFWMGQMSQGVSLADIAHAIAGSSEAKQSIPGFAGGGDHAGGIRLVGEDGPEIEVTGPSRIFNAQQTAAMLRGGGSDGETATLLAQLDASLKANGLATVQQLRDLVRLIRKFDTDGMPETRNVTA